MKRDSRYIVIDITAIGRVTLYTLDKGGACFKRTYPYRRNASFLTYLLSYMRRIHCTWEDARGIALIEGRGSFSATRAAAAVLHIMSWQKKIPVAGFDSKAYADDATLMRSILRYRWPRGATSMRIVYQGEPHITAPRGALGCVRTSPALRAQRTAHAAL